MAEAKKSPWRVIGSMIRIVKKDSITPASSKAARVQSSIPNRALDSNGHLFGIPSRTAAFLHRLLDFRAFLWYPAALVINRKDGQVRYRTCQLCRDRSRALVHATKLFPR